MKKTLIFLAISLLLSACTYQNKNPLNKIEDAVSETESLSELERSLKQDSLQQQAQQDLNTQQLNQNSKPTQETNTKQTKDQNTINLTQEEITKMSQKVSLKTSKGEIVLKLFPDIASQTVKNFLTKAKSNHYNNLTFHRVEDWVIQGGDPSGDGTGGGVIPTELSKTPFVEGSLGVARGGDIRISNDSQFFICTKDCAWLTGEYTNFGQVTEGMDVVKNIQVGDTIESIEPIDETDK